MIYLQTDGPLTLDVSSNLNASGTGHKLGQGFTKDKDGEIKGASYAG